MLRLSNEKRGGKWELQRGAGTWERSVNLQRVWVSFHHHLCHPECHLNLRPPSPHQLMTCRAHYTQTNAQTPSCPNVCIPTVENKVEENSKFFYDEMLTVVQQILQTTAPFRRCGSNKTTLSDTRKERRSISQQDVAAALRQHTAIKRRRLCEAFGTAGLQKWSQGGGERRQGKGGAAGETACDNGNQAVITKWKCETRFHGEDAASAQSGWWGHVFHKQDESTFPGHWREFVGAGASSRQTIRLRGQWLGATEPHVAL